MLIRIIHRHEKANFRNLQKKCNISMVDLASQKYHVKHASSTISIDGVKMSANDRKTFLEENQLETPKKHIFRCLQLQNWQSYDKNVPIEFFIVQNLCL